MKPSEKLTGAARRQWERMMPLLEGGISEADRAILEGVCTQYAEFLEMARQVEEEGLLMEAMSGDVQPHPRIWVAERNLRHMRRILKDYATTNPRIFKLPSR